MIDIQEVFIKKGLTLSLAESCTGGLIAHMLTKTAGSSNYFLGSFVTYSEQMKMDILGVDQQTLAEKTAVSPDVAVQMCVGALKAAKSDYAISVTGDAGPDGDQVGTVYAAIGTKDAISVGKIPGLKGLDRHEIQSKCAGFLLLALYQLVAKEEVPFAHQ